MDVAAVESRLGVQFPLRHRAALLNPADPIHDACDFLLAESPHELLRLADVHGLLHGSDCTDGWPAFLVAFASNGCGDYFAYDLRHGMQVIYIDPDLSVAENLSAKDRLRFDTFDQWYE